jgi:hypothetical protein
MVCCGTKKGVEKLQASENIFSFIFVAACLPAGKFLAFDFKGFNFQFPGVSPTIASGSEIKPVEPGQGNACEGKEDIYLPFSTAFPSYFLTDKI